MKTADRQIISLDDMQRCNALLIHEWCEWHRRFLTHIDQRNNYCVLSNCLFSLAFALAQH